MVIKMVNKKTEQAMAATIADILREHRQVSVKGLGTFSVQHQKQDHVKEKDGRILLIPPTDVITFIPE